MPNVHVGHHAIVDAGSVVSKDIPDYMVVAWNPTKVLMTYEEYKKEWRKDEKCACL